MTLASWFSSRKPSHRGRTRHGGRRDRSRAFDGSALVEALEARLVLSSVSFGVGGETVDEAAGTFSIPVTLSGAPTPSATTFASGLSEPHALAFDSSGDLFVANA